MRLWLPEKATMRRTIKGFVGAACVHRRTTSTSYTMTYIGLYTLLFLCFARKIPSDGDKSANAKKVQSVKELSRIEGTISSTTN